MNDKINNPMAAAAMVSNNGQYQSKSVTFNLDGDNASSHGDGVQSHAPTVGSSSTYGEGISSQTISANQGLTPDCIRVVSEAINGPLLQEEAAKELAEQATFRIRTLLQDAQKYMTHAKRKKLTREDLDLALRVEGQEPLYGTVAAEHLPFRFASGGGRELHFTEEKELDLNELVNGPNGGLPKIPLGPSLRAHWLAIDGVQPSIPENPPASDKDQLLKESTNPLSKLNKHDAIDNKLGVLLQNQKPGLAAARLKTTETVNVKQLAKHELSVEQQLYYKEITEACVGSDEPRRAEALQSLACDPGLHQMLPRLCTFIAEGVRVNVVQHNLAILIYLMRMVKSLLENQTLFLEKYLHELIPAVTTCIVARQLCARPDVDNHWALRDFASRLMSNICKNFNTSTNNVQTRMTRMYAEALMTERPLLVSYYGAIAGLQELGPEVIKVFVLPHVKAISARIDTATESVNVMGGATNMEKIAASHIKNLLVKGCTPVLKTVKQPPDILDDYKEEYGSIGQYFHANVSRSRGSGSSANVSSAAPSGPPTTATTLPPNIAQINKTVPTLVRLTSAPTGNPLAPQSALSMGSEQISLAGQAQTLTTVITSNSTAVSMSNSGAVGSNATQKIFVMSPSQTGQVQMDFMESALPENSLDGETEATSLDSHSQQTDYSNGYEDQTYLPPPQEFELVNNVVCDGISNHKEKEVGISTLAFDLHEDLLWAGTKSGHVTSYYGTHLQKYTSFQVHPTDEVRNILTMDESLMILSNRTLRSQFRSGVPGFTHSSESMCDMHSLMYNSRTGRLLMGGMQNKLIEFDLTSVKELKQVDVESKTNDGKLDLDPNGRGTCAILREHSRFIVSGDVPAGRIHLRDPLNLKVAHTLKAHTGMLSDFDVHGNHLVTCGNSTRNGIEQPDRFLMVYDLRILRAISPIPIHVPPYQLRFLPSMSSRIAVVSSLGQVQLVDTAALISPQTNMFQVNMSAIATGESCNTISMDISPSNQCLAFGDSLNEVYLYSSVSEPAMNPFARETEFAEPVPSRTPMSIDDELAIYSKIPRPYLPVGQTTYLSDYWPEKYRRQAYRPTPAIDPEILKTMKVMETGGIKVGYARNVTNMRRNQMQYPEVLRRINNENHYNSGLEFNSDDKGAGNNPTGNPNDLNRGDGAYHSNIPKSYRKIAIKLSKMGSDDFDFDRYNRTGFCGLEASLPNSYSNAMLQILYYTEKLRILLLNHTCSRENCICCELSFLFHMMDISPGMPCQSSNFLRALRTIAEASALGLVFVDQGAVWKSNVPRLAQSWNRFILQQIHAQSCIKKGIENLSTGPYSRGYNGRMSSPMKTAKPSTQSELEDMSRVLSAACEPKGNKETAESDSLFTKLLGIKQEKVNTCTRCKDIKINNDIMHLCNLIYPDATGQDASKEVQKKDLTEIICSSLCPEQTTPAWCDKCRKYQTTTQTRNIRSMPCVLSLNCGNDNPQDLAFWQAQHELLYADNAPLEENKTPMPVQQPPPNVKPCRYGIGCTRPDCKFWHPESDSTNQQNIDIGAKCAKIGVSWIPSEMTLHRKKDGKITYGNEDSLDPSVVETKVYQLYGVCYVILDPSNGQANNIVAAINVGPTYHARVASPVSQWYIFNDFSINMITPEEALSVNLSWKIPTILFYQAREMPQEIKDIDLIQPITVETFSEDKSLTQSRAERTNRKRLTFIPLQADEMPKKGDMVAIDAEFVTLNQEESELRSDGKISTIKAAQMSVARITCVRGSGPFEGSPFIDDYISTQEQVVDYVTKFSGIKPGDLDANFSSKHLTTLKSTYKKLRYLIDTGCIFIGHGLKNDFKVINVVVPPDQVIDTVHLFHLPHHRMVSLKFLAWHFLEQKIQGVVHDSIEDAVTALSLYKKYLELKKEDKLIEALNKLYEHGKEANWKAPED